MQCGSLQKSVVVRALSSTAMFRCGSMGAPHHGQVASWAGEVPPELRPFRASRMAFLLSSKVLGAVWWPTQSPSVNVSGHHVPGSFCRSDYIAQRSVEARWNCCTVSRRSV